jgi:hypothetical protein
MAHIDPLLRDAFAGGRVTTTIGNDVVRFGLHAKW